MISLSFPTYKNIAFYHTRSQIELIRHSFTKNQYKAASFIFFFDKKWTEISQSSKNTKTMASAHML